jgi:pimeloyl-ACP methyl ester carboxylesterase
MRPSCAPWCIPAPATAAPRAHAQRWQPDYLHRQAVEILPALLAQLGVASHPAWLIGHSDGASIALLYAAAFPERVDGVIALAPHVLVEPTSLQGIRAAREAYLHASLRNKLSRYHDDVDSAFWGWNDIWLDPAFATWNIQAQLAQIRAPVLVIQGADDEYGSPVHLQRILAHVPGAAALELEQCGHAPQRDCPHLVNPAILEFIGAARQRGATGLAADSGH